MSSTPVSTVFDRFAQHRPAAARRVLSVATLAVLTMPAATILAIVTGHVVLAEFGVFASILFYTTGYATAAARHGRQLRAAVAEARRDPLTGLPSRAVADEVLDAATRDATPVTVALADIDGLHAINMNLGLPPATSTSPPSRSGCPAPSRTAAAWSARAVTNSP
jgi:hypothetical protein